MTAYGKVIASIVIFVMALGAHGAGQKYRSWTVGKPALMSGDSITLKWSPKDSTDTIALLPIKKCEIELTIQDVIDSRTDKAFLGKNIQRIEPKMVYVKGDFGQWVKQNLERYLSKKCPDAAKGKKFLVGITITKFEITESKMYNCSWEAEVAVKDADSTLLSRQKLMASAETWGRSFNEKNYATVTSNGVVQLVNGIIGLDVFKKENKVIKVDDTTPKDTSIAR